MKGSVVTVGTFDGVHRGHDHLIKKLILTAREHNMESVLVTLDAPVRKVQGLLTTAAEKEEILRSYGMNKIIFLPNSSQTTKQTAFDFFAKFIRTKLNAEYFIAGENFAFGFGREGNTEWLKNAGLAAGVKTLVVSHVCSKGSIISSTRIRELIAGNKVADANKLLGRFYSIDGRHCRGRGVGTKMGYPTINLEIAPEKLLPQGVMAAWVSDGKDSYPSVINIGVRPTFFSNSSVSLEAYLLGYAGEWKHSDVTVYLAGYIRPEKRYKSMAALKSRISKDVAEAKKYFGDFAAKARRF